MQHYLPLFLSSLCCLSWAADKNLLVNGDFEKGKEAPTGWHIRLADYMPKTLRDAEGNRTGYEYYCGCGAFLGTFKPWGGLACPKCKGFIGGEESGAWYLKNHERVSFDKGKNGRSLKFTLPTAVGNNQGVRVYSNMVKLKSTWGYVLSFDTKVARAHTRVFAEGYRLNKSPEGYKGCKAVDVSGVKKPIERVYRAHVNCDSPPAWKHFTKNMVPPARYKIEWVSVKLYAYMPGEAWFDNVVLRPMTPAELDNYFIKKKKPKDKRFKYK